MNKYKHLKDKAIELRKNNYSLNLICEMFSLPKTTVYYWVKDIECNDKLNGLDKKRGKNKKKNYTISLRFAKLRKDAYDSFYNIADNLLLDKYLRDFVMIYLTEGYRKCKNTVQVSNSNEMIILLSQYWMKKFSNKNINYNVQIHIDNNEDKIKEHWASILSVDKNSIKIRMKSNSGNMNGRKWRCEWGVMGISVHDTYLRSKIQALMDYLQENWNKFLNEVK